MKHRRIKLSDSPEGVRGRSVVQRGVFRQNQRFEENLSRGRGG
jgi:hypothetical protein